MRIYIATSLSNALAHREAKDLLEARGHTLTFDWNEAGPVNHTSLEELSKRGHEDFLGVMTADVLLVLMPGGKGTHVEIGIALGAGRPVVIVDPNDKRSQPYPCVFHYCAGVVIVDSVEEALDLVTPLPSPFLRGALVRASRDWWDGCSYWEGISEGDTGVVCAGEDDEKAVWIAWDRDGSPSALVVTPLDVIERDA